MGNETKLGIAKIPVRATLDELDKDLSQAKSKAQKSVDGINSVFSKIGIGTIAAGTAIAGLTKFMGDAVEMAKEAERIQANLNATLESTQGAAGLTVDEINNMAAALSQLTTFEDDAIVEGQAMLLTFTNIGKDVFPQATEAMLNMTEKFGSMGAASVQLGKALNDPVTGVTALRRVGVMLTEQQEEQIKKFVEQGDIVSAQKVILAELETEFGGLAKAMGETSEGQMTILNNKLGNMQEAIGAGVLPVLGDLITKITEIVEPFTGMNDQLTELTEGSVHFAASPLFAALENAAIAAKALNEVLEAANSLLEILGINAHNDSREMTILNAILDKLWTVLKLVAGGPLVLINEGLKEMVNLFEMIKSLNVTQIFEDLQSTWNWGSNILGFASGGVVPGPIGMPQLAVVHGGEVVVANGESYSNATTINQYLTVNSQSEKSVIREFAIMRSLAGA